MQWLAEICVRRPVFATVIVLALSVVGYFSYTRLGVDRFPKVDFPIVTVTLREDGASPEEMETDVVDKVEEAVNTISSIDQLTSVSYDGVGQVIITFQLEKNIDVAVEEVRAKVNGILNDLPLDVKAPIIDKVDPDAAPILNIALSAPSDIRSLTEYADKRLRRQIESISGVGQVTILGGQKRQVNIDLNPYELRKYNLAAADVQRALQSQNIQVPGGQLDEGTRKITIRTRGRVQTPAQFNDLIIAQRSGALIHLSDVGIVHDSTEEPSTVADIGRMKNGVFSATPTVLLAVRKQSGLNTVATVDAVRERLNEIKATLPHGYTLEVVRDQSTYIRAATDAVKEHLIVGSILAAIVVMIFLWNIRTTIISAIAIPTSIVSTFALMYARDFTLNSLTLLALTLSVGIVIDDAIVVLENIYRFIEEKGMNPFEAAIEGTREIGMAVLATTLSLIAVFLPVAFMSGIVGRFLNSFGLTMAFAIFVSLIVSFTLTPMLASRWIKPKAAPAGGPASHDGMPVGVSEEGVAQGAPSAAHNSSKSSGIFGPIDLVYTALLKWCIGGKWGWHRVFVLAACFAALAAIPIVGAVVPKNFLPEDDESQFQISVRAPEGYSLTSTQQLGDSIARATMNLPDVAYTITTIGDNAQQTENLASVFVKLKEVKDRKDSYTQQDITQMVRTKVLPQFGSLRTSAGPVQAISTGAPAATVVYSLAGRELDKLTLYSQNILKELKKVPGVVDADTNLIAGKPEIGLQVDRQKAADLGVSVQEVANAIRILIGGQKVTDYFEGGEQYEVHLRAALDYRSNPQQLSEIIVPSSTGNVVTLDQVTKQVPTTGPAQVNRLNRQRNVLITCNVLPGYSQQAVGAKLEQIVQAQHMPPGYEPAASGNSRELGKAAVAFVTSFLLAIIFMYLILAAQFESWIHPITILIALPLTLPFALISILVFHQSINIFTTLGMLVLFGVVKKNGILQVDHTNQLRAHGMNRYDAIIQANRDRLRPILMTTIAFVAGLIPLILSSGTGAATNRGIGYTVIGGQTLSLLLTLLATPVFYSLFDDIGLLFGRLRRKG